MNNIIWWVGAIVIVLFVLGYLGFRSAGAVAALRSFEVKPCPG